MPESLRQPDRDAAPPVVGLGVLLVAGLWLVSRPYIGLAHDGVLYLGQALFHIRPDVMGTDVFFAHGSQDQFSLFARLLAQAYRQFDLPLVQMTALVLCHLTLLWAVWHLLTPLQDRERWLGLCALAIFSHQYGGHAVFAFAERFVTARTLAEPLALLALLALLRGRPKLAAACGLACGVIHPLVAISAALVAWCWLAGSDRRWYWALPLVLLGLAAGSVDADLARRLSERYDDVWWASVSVVVRHVFISTWGVVDFAILGFDALLLVLARRWLPTTIGRLCVATLAASLLALVISGLGADLGRHVLLTQLQLWRVLWIAHLLALALLPALVLRAWRSDVLGTPMAAALAMAAVTTYTRWPLSWVFVAWAAMLVVLSQRQVLLTPGFRRGLSASSLAVLALVSLAVMNANRELLVEHSRAFGHIEFALLLASTPALALPASWFALSVPSISPWRRILTVAALVGMAAYGAAHWDRRSDVVRMVEDGLHREHPFRALVPRNAQVLWWEQPAAAWVLLQRASYWSIAQGSGLLFNRETAIDYRRRFDAIAMLDMQVELCRSIAALRGADGGDTSDTSDSNDTTDCAPTREIIQRLCRTTGGPSHMVFERKLDGATAHWTAPAVHAAPRTWYLYDCAHFR